MNIEDLVYEELKKRGFKVSTAESCTGGLLSGKIINVSGASSIIDMAFVTYSNESKCELLNVNMDSIKKYGVVSEQVAGEMATNVAKKSKSNVGLSTSGIAGPTGATDKKPVGMVCFGISINGRLWTFTHIFENISRSYIRNSSVDFILEKLLYILKTEF